MAFQNMAEVRQANKAVGNHWFDLDTMGFFNCQIETELIAGQYFVSSEQRSKSDSDRAWPPRLYTVRRANKDGSIETVGQFQGYPTKAAARTAIRELVSDA